MTMPLIEVAIAVSFNRSSASTWRRSLISATNPERSAASVVRPRPMPRHTSQAMNAPAVSNTKINGRTKRVKVALFAVRVRSSATCASEQEAQLIEPQVEDR
jgi:hypothetical protein